MTFFKPLTIGTCQLDNNIIAAPLAGFSSLPYRILVREMGCGLVMSEMVSAEGILYGKTATEHYYQNHSSARPFAIQLFTANPDAIKRALDAIQNEPVDIIDINMGCPVKKVVRKGAGAALMTDIKRAEKIVIAARQSTQLPLTIKIRSGWDSDHLNYIEFGKMAEHCGCDTITLHPRTRQQMFKGHSNWAHIRELKEAISIPVIGNGDILHRDHAIEMIQQTNCDGIMIGRASIGKPWIFKHIIDNTPLTIPLHEKKELAITHFELLAQHAGNQKSVLIMRSILPRYTKGLPDVKAFMRIYHRLTDKDAAITAIYEFFNAATHKQLVDTYE